MLLALSVLVSSVLGWIIVRWVWSSEQSGRLVVLLQVSLGVSLGQGIAACVYFLWLVLLGPPGLALPALELAIILGWAWYAYLHRQQGLPIESITVASPRVNRIVLAIFVVSLAAALVNLASAFLRAPHGDADAWSIWNLRARFLYRAGPHWRDAFAPQMEYSHLDYPLLVPGAVAHCWVWACDDTTLAPRAVAACFCMATIGVLITTTALLRDLTQGLLAGAVLLNTRAFLELAVAQYADVPLTFFFLATLACVLIADARQDRRLYMLAGLLAALAAWTKNEGIQFILVVMMCRFLLTIPKRAWRNYARQTGAFLLGAFPVGMLLLYFKTFLAPSNDLVAGQGLWATFERISNRSRYDLVAQSLYNEWFALGPGMILVLAVFGCLVGLARSVERKSARLPVLVFLMMLAGYYGVYLTSPHDLEWHLRTSARRLLLQLWPMFLLAYFLLIAGIHRRSEPEALAKRLS